MSNILAMSLHVTDMSRSPATESCDSSSESCFTRPKMAPIPETLSANALIPENIVFGYRFRLRKLIGKGGFGSCYKFVTGTTFDNKVDSFSLPPFRPEACGESRKKER